MSILKRWVPIVVWLPSYRKSWLRPDLLAGLTVWALLVPEAMAYAEIAGMPPETGLYAAIGAIIGYAIFGTSRQLFVGPSSTVAILSAATVASVALGDDWVDVTIALALMVGAMLIVAGLLRMGFVSVFMSKPVLIGFTFGLGLVIAVGQLNKLFGVEGGDGNLIEQVRAIIEDLPDADLRTSLIGLVSLAILLFSRKVFGHKYPMALAVVFGSILLSNVFDWEENGVHVVGDIPASLPTPVLPSIEAGQWGELVAGAVGIVLIAFAESYGTAKNFARRHDYEIGANQEMVALGVANVGAGLLGGFTVDGSLSRSSAADEANAKSQMTMLICGAITVVTILAFTPVFEQLPEAVLAAVVISAVWGTFNIAEMGRIWRSNKSDFLAAIVALLGVCLIDLLTGLLLAIGISFILLVYRSSRPGMPTLGRIPGERFYVSTETAPHALQSKEVIVVRLDAPLFFANVEAFHNRIDELVAAAETPPAAVVLDLETVNFIDTDGGDELRSIFEDLQADGIECGVSRLNKAGRDALRHNDVYDVIGDGRFFRTVDAAVRELGAHED
jgi:SulP family sulfate permease